MRPLRLPLVVAAATVALVLLSFLLEIAGGGGPVP